MIALALQDLDATEQAARMLAPLLREGDVVELHGEIGAGKTTLVRLLAQALGACEPVRSPTYTVAHRYELADGGALAHLDCWRATGELDASAWGDVEPCFDGAVACIEWPAPVARWIEGRPRWVVRLDAVSDTARVLRVQAPPREGCGRALISAAVAHWSGGGLPDAT